MIPDSYKKNFQTLLTAFANDDVALLECTDKKTGEPAYIVVAIVFDGVEYDYTPFARMFDESPYDILDPPNTAEPTLFRSEPDPDQVIDYDIVTVYCPLCLNPFPKTEMVKIWNGDTLCAACAEASERGDIG